MKNKIREMIEKYELRIGYTPEGKEGVRYPRKMKKKDVDFLGDNKDAFIAELKVIKAEEKAREEREAELDRQRKEADIAALKSGEKLFKLEYKEGEYLSGYTIYGDAEKELLSALGIGSDVMYWGYHIPSDAIPVLGKEFTYEQAEAYARPALEEKARKAAEKEAAIAAKFAEAKKTGKSVLLRSGMDECDGSVPDCSIDNLYWYAEPDGSTRFERVHTF